MLKMDKNTFKTHVKTVKESILDEQKLVTYVSLSKDLCIHINDAKSLLNQTIQDIRESGSKTDIYVCYMISGLLKNNSAYTTVCSETEIDVLKETSKVIFYEHVYSVSCGTKGVDNVALTAVNKLDDFPLYVGLIKSNLCTKRTDDELGNLKSSSNNGVSTIDSKQSIMKKTMSEKTKGVTKNGSENVKEVHKVKSEPVLRSKTPSPKKDSSTNNNKPAVTKTISKPASKGIAGFFNKANGDSNKTKTPKVKEEKKIEETVSKVEPAKVKEEPSDTDKEVPVKVKKQEPTSKPKEKQTNNSSLKQIKKNAKVDKKRKRVLHVSDSESDTEANDPFSDNEKMAVDPESEDEIPPTPTVNTVKITSGIVNPKKKRKIVDKTYTDEDGYILTKKEEVYESYSDNEVEAKENVKQEKENVVKAIVIKTETSPKESGKSKKKKVSPPQKGKQQTLMSFFKKA